MPCPPKPLCAELICVWVASTSKGPTNQWGGVCHTLTVHAHAVGMHRVTQMHMFSPPGFSVSVRLFLSPGGFPTPPRVCVRAPACASVFSLKGCVKLS